MDKVYELEKKLLKKQQVTEQDFANLSPSENMFLAKLLVDRLNRSYTEKENN